MFTEFFAYLKFSALGWRFQNIHSLKKLIRILGETDTHMPSNLSIEETAIYMFEHNIRSISSFQPKLSGHGNEKKIYNWNLSSNPQITLIALEYDDGYVICSLSMSKETKHNDKTF